MSGTGRFGGERSLVGRTLDRAVSALPRGSLRQRAAASAFWRLVGHGGTSALRLGSNLIMTRLLVPEAFGLMAFVFTVHTGLIMMTDVGLRVSVMRSPNGDERSFVRTAWTLQVLQFSAMSLVLLLIGAGLWAVQQSGSVNFGDTVYGAPEMPLLIAASAFLLTLQGLQSMQQTLAERAMRVRRLVLLDIASQAITVVAMVGFAMLGWGVWSLMWGAAVGGLVRTLTSHLMLPGPRMGFEVDRVHALEIWRFGRWLIGASLLGFIATNGDKLLLGALFDATTFGLYAIASIWIMIMREGISRMLEPTALALLGEVGRARPEEVGRVFRRFRLAQDAICGTAFLAALIGGPPFIALLYEPEYHPAGTMVALLSLQLLLQRYAPFTQLLLHVGDSRSIVATTVATATGMLAVPYAAFVLVGPEAAILAVALNALWAVPIQLMKASRHVPISLPREGLAVAIILVAAAGVFALVG